MPLMSPRTRPLEANQSQDDSNRTANNETAARNPETPAGLNFFNT
jgi:hypothetical protein